MKKTLLFLALAAVTGLAGCDDDSTALPNGSGQTIETTEEGSSTFVLQGYENAADGYNTLKIDGLDDVLYLKDKQLAGSAYNFADGTAGRLDQMNTRPADNAWQPTTAIVAGQNYWARHRGLSAYTYIKLRVAYIEGNNVGLEYAIDGSENFDLNENTNANTSADADRQRFVTDYSIPAMNQNNYYVEHTVTMDNETILNYALEWDNTMRHAAWVAFSFDATTSPKNFNRPDEDPWDVDPLLPSDMQTSNDQHRMDGFDRGHLCASNDRVYVKEANDQTFYYSNISPQLNDFNTGFWAALEDRIQRWARSGNGTSVIPNENYDKLYVAKGGTLNELLTNFTGSKADSNGIYPSTDGNGFTKNGVACPKYYFMAILSEKGDNYHAIGFLVEHSETLPDDPPADDIKACAMSIDELEERTGLDFFCNLPDLIENTVEASFSLNDWTW